MTFPVFDMLIEWMFVLRFVDDWIDVGNLDGLYERKYGRVRKL